MCRHNKADKINHKPHSLLNKISHGATNNKDHNKAGIGIATNKVDKGATGQTNKTTRPSLDLLPLNLRRAGHNHNLRPRKK